MVVLVAIGLFGSELHVHKRLNKHPFVNIHSNQRPNHVTTMAECTKQITYKPSRLFN